ncbi:MAG TPA: phosphotransferase [Ktedonobacteraceae bacterium]|jgi:spectinomycin phosphotransferase
MREQPVIADELLRTVLQNQYNLGSLRLEFLPLGLDYQAAVYRVVSPQAGACLLKITSRPLYESRYLLPYYLNAQGIAAVVAPRPTSSGDLWVRLADWTVIVYPWVSGDSRLTGMTDEQWRQLGGIFKQIHLVNLPAELSGPLRKETFDAEAYLRWIHTFERNHLRAAPGENAAQRALRADWLAHQATIHRAAATLVTLADVLQKQAGPSVCCHADLHPANLIRDTCGQVFVIDWDDVMLAPRERDFIFLKGSGATAFWEGYGWPQIDWVALTYYRWERVVQDIIECAGDLFNKERPREAETGADIARLFHEILLGESSTIHAARAAASHLPANLAGQ